MHRCGTVIPHSSFAQVVVNNDIVLHNFKLRDVCVGGRAFMSKASNYICLATLKKLRDNYCLIHL